MCSATAASSCPPDSDRARRARPAVELRHGGGLTRLWLVLGSSGEPASASARSQPWRPTSTTIAAISPGSMRTGPATSSTLTAIRSRLTFDCTAQLAQASPGSRPTEHGGPPHTSRGAEVERSSRRSPPRSAASRGSVRGVWGNAGSNLLNSPKGLHLDSGWAPRGRRIDAPASHNSRPNPWRTHRPVARRSPPSPLRVRTHT
jgi:hypothetical protein